MKNKSVLLSAAALAVGLGMGVPAQADPPPWSPAHGYRAKQAREYKYVYYPAQQVYYAPATSTWFWLNGGNWQFGVNLPTEYRGYISSGVPVVLHSERPYVEHVYVEEHYGQPWRDQHRHEDGNGRRHKDKHTKHEKHGHGHHDHDD